MGFLGLLNDLSVEFCIEWKVLTLLIYGLFWFCFYGCLWVSLLSDLWRKDGNFRIYLVCIFQRGGEGRIKVVVVVLFVHSLALSFLDLVWVYSVASIRRRWDFGAPSIMWFGVLTWQMFLNLGLFGLWCVEHWIRGDVFMHVAWGCVPCLPMPFHRCLCM